jgi:vancomycin permeability regulator SanA
MTPMLSRVLAFFIGLFTLANLLGGLLWPGFDANLWWISFGHRLPVWLTDTLLAISAVALVAFALRHRLSWQRARFTAVVAATLALVALWNTITFYRLLAAGRISAGFPLPLSLIMCAGLIFIARTAWLGGTSSASPRRLGTILMGSAGAFALFPLALMLFFGNTDYRRPADAAVVFGAKVFPDGRLSDALADRIRTACGLYQAGLVRRLVLSGGPGQGAVTEAEAMRHYALSHGVPAQDIIIDNQGLNTEATVRDTMPMFREWHARRILVISHFYHLPRIKLAYERAGMEVYTVPARQEHFLGRLPFYMAREVAAFWSYYLKDKPTVGVARS